MKTYRVSEEFLQKVLDHLVELPFNKVFPLVDEIQALTPESQEPEVLPAVKEDFTPTAPAIPEWINEKK